MGRIIVLVLALALIAFTVKYALEPKGAAQGAHTEPRRQLDNVREKTHQFEQDAQKQADQLLKESEEK